MGMFYANLTDQVDGVEDTFELPLAATPGQLIVSYNGVEVREENITVIDSTHFQLSFVPELLKEDTLTATFDTDFIGGRVQGFTYDPTD